MNSFPISAPELILGSAYMQSFKIQFVKDPIIQESTTACGRSKLRAAHSRFSSSLVQGRQDAGNIDVRLGLIKESDTWGVFTKGKQCRHLFSTCS